MTSPRTASIAVIAGEPTLLLDGHPTPPVMYSLTDVPAGRWSWEEVPQRNIALFAGIGIALVQLDIFSDHLWREDGTLDLDLARRQVAGVLAVAPEASVMFRLHINAPRWWLTRHPEEAVAYADAAALPDPTWGLNRPLEWDERASLRVSLASQRWIDDAVVFVERFCRGLAAMPEGDAIFGIQIAGGVFGEWHQWGFIQHEPDVGPAMTARFRAWLGTRYGDDAGLRAAWADPAATIAAAAPPDLAARRLTAHGIYRDPVAERPLIDYFRCLHESVADAIRAGCTAVKRAWPRPILAGAFYGYFHSTFGRQVAGGHLESTRVLSDPAVDFLCAPSDYYTASHATGEAYRSRGLITSCRFHGKLWLDEMDKRPGLPPGGGDEGANLRRDLLYGQCRGGAGLWFYDFGPSGFATPAPGNEGRMARGWWDDPVLLAAIRAGTDIRRVRTGLGYRTGADVLVVYDTQGLYHLTQYGQQGLEHILDSFVHVALFRSGFVHDECHLDDVVGTDLSPYRAVVVMNAWMLTPQRRVELRTALCRDGRSVVWLCSPGYCDGASLDVAHASATVGMQLARCAPDVRRRVRCDGLDGMELSAWDDQLIDPLLAVEDPTVEVLGRFVDSALVGAARRVGITHTDWFLALPNDTPAFWRALLSRCGCHAYGAGNEDVHYAGGGLVVVHGRAPGARTITLRDGRTVEVVLGADGGTVAIDSGSGSLVD